jgi:hypothetical protein
MGPITAALKEMYQDALHGRLPKYRHWNVPVYERSLEVEPALAKVVER